MSNLLVTIEKIKEVKPHPNADKLDICVCKGYECIVGKDQVVCGDLVVFIQPDTVLPDWPEFELFNKRSSRVKAIKLRGSWSFGIVMPFSSFGKEIRDKLEYIEVGVSVEDIIPVTKYEAPQPQNLEAKGFLPRGLPKTDEERWQNLSDNIKYGSKCDITLKIDGQSATYYCFKNDNGEWETGVCSRQLTIKPESQNNYTFIEKKYNILEKLKEYCVANNQELAIRGEIYGGGIQGHKNNPHAKLNRDFMVFSLWNKTLCRYEYPNGEHNYEKVAKCIGIPVVPKIEEDVVITKDIIEKYSQGIKTINGNYFEGVVCKYHDSSDSFKIINMEYDAGK